jgi:hypothetical protein
LAGCISDGATKPVAVAQLSKPNPGNQKSENSQMRYYGGPKSPMWRTQ